MNKYMKEFDKLLNRWWDIFDEVINCKDCKQIKDIRKYCEKHTVIVKEIDNEVTIYEATVESKFSTIH